LWQTQLTVRKEHILHLAVFSFYEFAEVRIRHDDYPIKFFKPCSASEKSCPASGSMLLSLHHEAVRVPGGGWADSKPRLPAFFMQPLFCRIGYAKPMLDFSLPGRGREPKGKLGIFLFIRENWNQAWSVNSVFLPSWD
jgi:hypothetical protein